MLRSLATSSLSSSHPRLDSQVNRGWTGTLIIPIQEALVTKLSWSTHSFLSYAFFSITVKLSIQVLFCQFRLSMKHYELVSSSASMLHLIVGLALSFELQLMWEAHTHRGTPPWSGFEPRFTQFYRWPVELTCWISVHTSEATLSRANLPSSLTVNDTMGWSSCSLKTKSKLLG